MRQIRTQKNIRSANHTFALSTRLNRVALWVVLFVLIFGSVPLTYTSGKARVLGSSIFVPRTQAKLTATAGAVVADTSLQAAASEPGFHIVSRTPSPQDQCVDDSFYTSSQDVWLGFSGTVQGSTKYTQYQVAATSEDLSSPIPSGWKTVVSSPCESAGERAEFNLADLGSSFTNSVQTHQVVNVYVRLRDPSTNTLSPIYGDTIFFGYPWVATQRGDVYAGGNINGEASFLSGSGVTPYSFTTCNPPDGSYNADYIVAMYNGNIQTISGAGDCNPNNSSFKTKGVNSTKVVNLSTPVALAGQVRFSDLEARANYSCVGDVVNLSVVDDGSGNNTGTINPENTVGCEATRDDILPSEAKIIDIESATPGAPAQVTISNSGLKLRNGNAGESGAITIVSSNANVTLESNLVYQDGLSTTPTSLNQLANFGVLVQKGDITISGSVGRLAGTFFSEQGTISTAQERTYKKLSLYGSLTAANIAFNRYWLGDPVTP